MVPVASPRRWQCAAPRPNLTLIKVLIDPGRPRIALDLEKRIRAALNERKHTSEGVRKIAKRFRVNASTVQRISASPFDGAASAAQSRRPKNGASTNDEQKPDSGSCE
jgi:hypothetical protein